MQRFFLRSRFLRSYVLAAAVALFGILFDTSAFSQKSPGPQPAALPAPIPAPVDQPYGGTISLSVDLTDVSRRILQVHETIPVKPGPITLLYPQWLPGTHSPSNSISDLAGLVITSGGTTIPWMRDRVDMWAFHVDVPKGATALDISFQYLAPIRPQQGRISDKIADLTWNSVLVYPAGYFSRRISFAAELRLPEGWKFASALEVKSQNGSVVQFKIRRSTR